MSILLAQATNPESAAQAGADDASVHLVHRVATRWDDLLLAVNSTNFYVELFLILVAFLAAGLLTRVVQRRVRNRMAVSPPRFIDAELITKPLLVLGPIIAIVFLWMTQIVALSFDIGGNFTGGVIELTYAYLLIKCVLLIVRSRAVAWFVSGVILINALLHALRISRSITAYLDSLAFDVGTYHFSILHLVQGLIIFVVVFWIAGILSQTFESYLRRSTKLSHNGRELTVKFFKLFVYLIACVITLSAVGIDLTALAVFSGALGVGIGLGLQKLTGNFVSGVTMLMEKSIKIGDLIEVGGNTGWVRQLNIRYALIETFDGREILIPNEELVSTRVINWTLTTTLARAEIKIAIDLDGDAKKAQKILLESALEHKLCLKDPAPGCWISEVDGNGIHFMLTFWIADIKEGRNIPQSDVLFSVLKKFRQNAITLARAPASA